MVHLELIPVRCLQVKQTCLATHPTRCPAVRCAVGKNRHGENTHGIACFLQHTGAPNKGLAVYDIAQKQLPHKNREAYQMCARHITEAEGARNPKMEERMRCLLNLSCNILDYILCCIILYHITYYMIVYL